METAPVGVAFDHRLDERLVNHIHFRLAVLVFERHFPAADDCIQFRKVVRNLPVQRDVGEWRLCAPAGRRIDPENKGFDTFLDL